MEDQAPRRYEFGGFILDAREKMLTKASRQISVTPKALEILILLVEDAGHVVLKEDLFQKVWAESFVEDANLTHHISRLRRSLEETDNNKFIETLARRGYRFVHPVREIRDALASNEGRGRTKLLLPLVGLALSAILIFVAWSALYRREEPVGFGDARPADGHMTVSRITNIGKVGGASISPDGRFIAYMQNHENGEGMLYVRQVDTNTELRLLPNADRIFGTVSFSADGSFIYYVAFDKNDPKGSLYRIPVLGGQSQRFVGDAGYMFSLSPDGRHVAFFREGPQKEGQLISASFEDGTERVLLRRSGDEMTFGTCPAWSPDGKVIVFAGTEPANGSAVEPMKTHLYSLDVASGVVANFTEDLFNDMGKIVWMADGSGVLAIADRPRTGGQIYMISSQDGRTVRVTRELNVYGHYGLGVTADGQQIVADVWEVSSQLWSVDPRGGNGNAEQLTTGINDGSRGLATTADGSIVYVSRTGNDFDLWLLKAQNGRLEGRPLTSDAFQETDVCVTPDGFIVFTSDRAGGQHLFRMNLDGTALKQLTFGEAVDRKPSCAADSTVIYSSVRSNRTTLQRISIEGGEPVQLTDYEADAPAISLAGDKIACILPSDNIVDPATLAIIPAGGGTPIKTFPVVPFAWSYRQPSWTPDGSAVIIGKVDNMVGNLWKQNIAGGELVKLTDFKSESMFNHAFSRDGKKLILSRGKTGADVVMIKNFR